MTVLIVEDEPVSRRALKALVSSRGMQVEAVESAEEALRQVSRAGLPTVALIDLELPGMNGMDLIRKLHGMRRETAEPFTVLMTAANMETVDRLRQDSSVPFLRKPLDFDRLMTLIENRD